MTVLPMGWVYSVPIFQNIHRRVALLDGPAGAKLPPLLEWRRDRPVPAAAAAPLSHQGAREWWSTYIDDFVNCETTSKGEALRELKLEVEQVRSRDRGRSSRHYKDRKKDAALRSTPRKTQRKPRSRSAGKRPRNEAAKPRVAEGLPGA